MLFLYYVGFAITLAVAGPFLLLKRKARAGLWQKLGFIPPQQKGSSAAPALKQGGIWFHAVSVGEFNAVKPLIEKVHGEHPDIPLYVSTTTATGQALAQEKVGGFATVFYFPFDLPFATGAWLQALKPSLVAVVETELWPGFVDQCHKSGIKIMTVNGRMSPKSFRTYHRLRFFFKEALLKLDCLCVQSIGEQERFVSIAGTNDLRVVVTGNMKLDGLSTVSHTAARQLRNELNLNADDFVIVAGSTHEGEESAAIDAFAELSSLWRERGHQCQPRLIIAPRHPERFQRACDIVQSKGFSAKRFSLNEKFERDNDIYILDGLGQLMKYYSLASLAFVGGSLAPIGGHSLLEPYAYGVPAICGPHTYKTRDIARALNELGALSQVQTAPELTRKIEQFYLNPSSIKECGQKGKSWIEENQGAVARTLACVMQLYDTTSGASAGSTGSTTRESISLLR